MSGRPLRVALVSEHASPLAVLGGADAGGQNVHVAALAAALARRGHAVEVLTRRDDPALPPVVSVDVPAGPDGRGGRVDVVHVPAGPARPVAKDDLAPHMPRFGAWLAHRWTRARGRRRPDVVHAHFWMSGAACLQARALTGVPVVQTFHALGVVKRRHQGAADPSPASRAATEVRLATDADAVLATCTDEVAELATLVAGTGRAAGAPVHVVPCGVDLAAFTPGAGAPAGPGRPLRVLSIGRLVERKGVDLLVAALAAAPGVELVVAGGPEPAALDAEPEVRRLRAVAQAHGVGDRVRFVGRVGRADVPAALRSADVVACVPWYEPFGIVPLEAMACGVPVVAAAVGGMLDTVVDGVTGLLVPPRDPASLAAALRALRDDPARRAAMGAAGVARARARYGWDGVAAATEAVYLDVLHRGVRGLRPADVAAGVPALR